MELFKANAQWSTRPDDEKFASLQSLYDATKGYADIAKEKSVAWSELRCEARDSDVQLIGKANVPAKLTHFARGCRTRRTA